MDVEEGHTRECVAEEHVSRDRDQANREVRPRMGKGFRGPGGENYEPQVMSVRTPEGFVRKSTWQVADVRRPLVSASHHPGWERLVHWEG